METYFSTRNSMQATKTGDLKAKKAGVAPSFKPLKLAGLDIDGYEGPPVSTPKLKAVPLPSPRRGISNFGNLSLESKERESSELQRTATKKEPQMILRASLNKLSSRNQGQYQDMYFQPLQDAKKAKQQAYQTQ